MGRQRPVLHGGRLSGAPPAGGDCAEQGPRMGKGECPSACSPQGRVESMATHRLKGLLFPKHFPLSSFGSHAMAGARPFLEQGRQILEDAIGMLSPAELG